MSNALLKSKEITVIYGLERSSRVIELRREMMAAAGDPVGRKANWSRMLGLEAATERLAGGIGVQQFSP